MTTLEKEKLARFINTLNSGQKQSVLSDATTLQILAGPGSGKTRVLTCRVAYLVIEKGIAPKNIIVVTFTNKAANEMKMRLVHLIGEVKTGALLIGTFHSICCRLLRRHGKVIGLKSDFTIADNTTSEDIIQKIRKDKAMSECLGDFTRVTMKAGAIYGTISNAKSKRIDHVQFAKDNKKGYMKDIAIIYKEYERQLANLNLVDFDNLLMMCCNLLEKKTDVLQNVKCILVDEYQDTNVIQYDLLKLMMAQINNKTVTIVGDPDQSIFGWRSAEPKNFSKMAEEFEQTQSISLEQNYRSTASILGAALHVIKQDPDRVDKSLFTNNPGGIPISLITVRDQTKQADFVASEIRKVITYSKGLIQYKDIAVLMRMNFISNDLETSFRNHKIPYVVVGGDRFFSRMEVKDIISYLEFIYNPSNVLAFQRIINVPKRGIGATTLKKITDLYESQQERSDLLTTLISIINGKISMGALVVNKLKQFVNICSHVREMMKDKEDVATILTYIIEKIEYEEYLKTNYHQDHIARWQNVGELINIATERPELREDSEDFLNNDDLLLNEEDHEPDDVDTVDMTLILKEEEEEHIEPLEVLEVEGVVSSDPIADFLEFCALCSNQKEQEEAEGGKVTIATIHASKGLEWPCVFIVTCVDGVIPHSRADLYEEGRLLYVGMTRSKFILYCISPTVRQQFGDYITNQKSRFLDGMDQSLYTNRAPDWDNDIRNMLALTLNKPAPSPDDTLVTKKSKNEKKMKRGEEKYGSCSQPVYTDIRFGLDGNKADLLSLGGFSSAANINEPYYSSSQPYTKRNKSIISMSQPLPKKEILDDEDDRKKRIKKEERN